MSWYRAGFVNVTQGSANVVGTDTLWLTQCKAGDIFVGPDLAFYEISSVTDDTHMAIARLNGAGSYAGTSNAAGSYAIIRAEFFGGATNADLAARLAALMTKWHGREDEFIAWHSGTADGGPNNDGTYPMTDPAAGVVTYVKCPARLEADVAALSDTIHGQFSTEPGPGLVPKAREDGTISADWIEPISVNFIGFPGGPGFGVGIAPPTDVPLGMWRLDSFGGPAHPQYGNYQYSDGSIMVWIPKFYYRIGHSENPTFSTYGVNSIDVKASTDFTSRADAEDSGYALHRAFIDGGVVQNGFFIDKYMSSKNGLGAGYVASSKKDGLPLSTSPDHNPITDLTACSTNAYHAAVDAPKARDGHDGEINLDSIFHCASRFQWAAIALLSMAHGQAAASATYCAWYDSSGVANYPKGCNNNALGDVDDTEVAYESDGYSNCGKTGSGVPFAKTTHNGQACGVADVNGLMYEIQIGLTCVATYKTVTGATQGNPCQLTVPGHGMTTGQQARITNVNGMVALNDTIITVTVIDPDHVALDGVDSSGYAAYTSGGVLVCGTFYAAKESVAMRDFTSGNSASTDHWGAAGVAAMMDALPLVFADGTLSMKMGDGANQVLAEDVSGDDWRRTCLGLPLTDGQSSSGTNLFGMDHFRRHISNEFCPFASCTWSHSANAGVWGLSLSNSRSYSSYTVGFRAACYPAS